MLVACARGWKLTCQAAALLLFTVAHVFGQLTAAPATSHIVLLDGSSIPLQSLEIAAEKISGEGLPAELVLDDLQNIELSPQKTPAEAPTAIAELRGGGRLLAKSVAIEKEKCRLTWSGGDPLFVPLDAIRTLRLQPATALPEFEKSAATPSVQHDRVFLTVETGNASSVSGLVESLTDEQLTIEVNAEKRHVPRERVYGIVVAQPAAAVTPPRLLVAFQDGSQLAGDSLSVASGKATLDHSAAGQIHFAWDRAANVRIRSRRVAYLSELKPASEKQQPIVTLPRPAQRNKSVGGQPLTIGTRVFESGLGVHAHSRLAFSLAKEWDVFAATIGLDASADGKGDCVFTVLADGEPLFSRRMRGGDDPFDLRAPISGRDELALLIEPGEGLDLADHADWCDARLIRNK